MLVILAVIGALLMVPGLVGAKATRYYLTGTETLDHIVDPGTWTFPDGNIHVRGFVQLYEDDCSDPRVSGWNTVVVNADWDVNWAGPMWGTFTVRSDEEVTWEGTWTGKAYADGSSFIRAQGHGRGPYEGLKYFVTIESGKMSGYILDPHGG